MQVVVTTCHPAENGIHLDVIMARPIHTDSPIMAVIALAISEVSPRRTTPSKRAVKLPISAAGATLISVRVSPPNRSILVHQSLRTGVYPEGDWNLPEPSKRSENRTSPNPGASTGRRCGRRFARPPRKGAVQGRTAVTPLQANIYAGLTKVRDVTRPSPLERLSGTQKRNLLICNKV